MMMMIIFELPRLGLCKRDAIGECCKIKFIFYFLFLITNHMISYLNKKKTGQWDNLQIFFYFYFIHLLGIER